MQTNGPLIDDRLSLPTARDVAAVVFRHRAVSLSTFFLVLLAAIFSLFLSPQYQSEIKFLVRRERLDPMITAQANAPPQTDREQISEEDLNSEVELLKSDDLLTQVVLVTGLNRSEHAYFNTGNAAEQVKIAKAVQHLANRLVIKPIQKTNLVSVTLTTADAARSAAVLDSLSKLYLEKHLKMHRPVGEMSFFDEQATRYRSSLQKAEEALTEFSSKENVIAAQTEQDLLLRQISEFDSASDRTRVDVAGEKQKLRTLQEMKGATNPRSAAQQKKTDNAQLLQTMKGTLLNLQLKRTQMEGVYKATSRPMQDLDRQIAETQSAIDAELRTPLREESDDRSQTYELITAELARTQAELGGLTARESANQEVLQRYKSTAHRLQEDSIVQADLLRNIRTEEDNYLLYVKKREEARINDALDRGGILNVGIAQEPTIPVLPRSGASLLIAWLLCAVVASTAVAYVVDMLDPYFRTPDQLARLIDVPVLAAVPKRMALPDVH